MSKRIIASEHGRGKRTREAEIVRASIIGIAANFLLAAFKAIVGYAVNSVAMKLDAVNNLSDALSSVLTIAGTKLAVKKPDKRHPFGYGRVEYLTSLSIGVLVLYAGINSMVASVRHILRPEAPDHSAASLIVTAVAIVGKLALGAYARRVGKRVGSTALLDSATDALLDALLSASVLVSALLTLLAGLNLDGWVGAVLSLFIMRAGVGMLRSSADDVLGRRTDPALGKRIRQTVCADDDVLGAYDLVLHSYGPEKLLGSLHVEVADTMTAGEIDRMERRIAERVFQAHGVLLTCVGIYASDRQSEDMRDRIVEIVRRHDGVLQVHGFFIDAEQRRAGFDLVLDYGLPDRQAVCEAVGAEVRAAFPDYDIRITQDIDV